MASSFHTNNASAIHVPDKNKDRKRNDSSMSMFLINKSDFLSSSLSGYYISEKMCFEIFTSRKYSFKKLWWNYFHRIFVVVFGIVVVSDYAHKINYL